MAKAVSKARTKKKKWYPLVAPKLFNEEEIGEAYVADPNELIGREVSMNIKELRSRRGQNMDIRFKVKDVKDGKGITYCKGFEMPTGAVNRFVRNGTEKVDDSFVLQTKDGIRVRIKPMMVTTNNTAKSVLTKMRNITKDKLREYFSKNTFNQIMDAILKTNLQKDMKDKLSKIYPIRNFEIRVMKMVGSEEPKEEATEEEPEEPDSGESGDEPEEESSDEEENSE